MSKRKSRAEEKILSTMCYYARTGFTSTITAPLLARGLGMKVAMVRKLLNRMADQGLVSALDGAGIARWHLGPPIKWPAGMAGPVYHQCYNEENPVR